MQFVMKLNFKEHYVLMGHVYQVRMRVKEKKTVGPMFTSNMLRIM